MAEQSLPSTPATEYKRSRLTIGQREAILGFVLVIPVVVCLLTLVFYPFFFAIWISFTDRTVGTTGSFVGFENYARLARNSSFQATIVNTIVIVGAVQAIKLVSGIAIAMLLNQAIRFRQGWRRSHIASLGHARVRRLHHLEAAVCTAGRRLQLHSDQPGLGPNPRRLSQFQGISRVQA